MGRRRFGFDHERRRKRERRLTPTAGGQGAGGEAAYTCASWLPILDARTPRRLLSTRSSSRLEGLCALFPGHCTTVFEIHLRRPDRVPDFSVRLCSPEEALSAARALEYGRLESFAHRWRHGLATGHPGRIAALWLEFDLDPRTEAPADPLLCARIEGPADPDWLTDAVLPALRSGPLGERQRGGVRRACRTVPRGARVLYAFSLHPRGRDAVRLELFGLAPPGMVAFLERMALPEAARRVARHAALLDGAERYHLSLDFADEILPRIGIECGWSRGPGHEDGWRRVLDRFTEHQLCPRALCDALLEWPGYDTVWTAPFLWPEAALRRGGYFVRCLSHFKLVSEPGRAPEAKAYLLAEHVRRDLATPIAGIDSGRAPDQDGARAGLSMPSSSASDSARPT